MAKPENRKPGAQPISRHPLFPAIVALWFAALFGLGSLIVSAALIERIVGALGIAKVLPTAAPPLGGTARILFALALTGVGGLIGLVIGRRVAQSEEDASVRMPFADFEADAQDAEPAEPAPSTAPRRCRAFALVSEGQQPLEERGAASEPENLAPILNLSDLDLESVEAAGLVDPAIPESHTAFAEAPLEQRPAVEPEEAPIPVEALEALAPAPKEEDARSPFGRIPEWLEPRQETHSFSPAAWSPIPAPEPEPQAPAPAPEALSNRLFEAYSRKSEAAPLFPSSPADLSSPEDASTAAEDESQSIARRIGAANLEALSQVELLERLALAMEQSRRKRPAPASPPVSSDSEVDAAAVAEPQGSPLPRLASVAPIAAPAPVAPEAPAEPSVPPQTARLPAALRPVGLGSALDDDDALPGYVPLRHIAFPTPRAVAEAHPAPLAFAPAVEETAGYGAFDTLSRDFEYDEAPEDNEEEAVLEQGYSSLLNLTRQSPRQSFVRFDEFVDEEPAAIGTEARDTEARPDPTGQTTDGTRPFDPPARPDPGETEKALRAALATLQRMSGAA